MTTLIEGIPLTDEGLDSSPVCECEYLTAQGLLGLPGGAIRCDKPAVWWGIALCCGERGLYCDSCKHRTGGGGGPQHALDICGACFGRGMRWVRL